MSLHVFPILVRQGTAAPVYQSSAAPLAASPAFFASYSSEAAAFVTAVGNLPAGYPGGTTAQTSAVGRVLCSRRVLTLIQGPFHHSDDLVTPQLPLRVVSARVVDGHCM